MSDKPHVVLLTTFHEPCGIATYSESLTAALRELGTEITVLAPHLRRAPLAPQMACPGLGAISDHAVRVCDAGACQTGLSDLLDRARGDDERAIRAVL